jgi:RHS repeat-associated protein
LYSYSVPAGGYDTNGNVLSYSDTVMGPFSFTYDKLNRLSTGTSAWNVNGLTNFSWSYDSFGNRTQQYASGPGGTVVQNASYTNQNQMVGLSYDGAGDVNWDGKAYLYDAEGRICAVNSYIYGGMTGYQYDTAGNRIAKGSITSMSCDVTQNGFQQEEGFVVGQSGEQFTEVGANNTAWHHTNIYAGGKLIGTYDAAGLHFHIDDPLGTRRVQVSSTGALEATYQSLPFGDGYNATAFASNDDPTENHFTGKERDVETGNDYFNARCYNSATGRFLSPDPLMASGHVSNPQSWNRYAYVFNNPLRFVDPTGMEVSSQCAKDKKCSITVKVM